jgi:hypothetical protein
MDCSLFWDLIVHLYLWKLFSILVVRISPFILLNISTSNLISDDAIDLWYFFSNFMKLTWIEPCFKNDIVEESFFYLIFLWVQSADLSEVIYSINHQFHFPDFLDFRCCLVEFLD